MNKKQEMWNNAFAKIDEKYIKEAAEFASEDEEAEFRGNFREQNMHGSMSPKKSGNLLFVIAAAAAVICCTIGAGLFLGSIAEVPVEPSANASDGAGKVITAESGKYYSVFLGTLRIDEGVTEIGSGAFLKRNDIKKVVIPDSVTKIGDKAFYGCENLSEITIPESVTEMYAAVFYNCLSLKEITVPDKVEVLYDRVFYGCKNLEKITLPDGLTKIGEGAFENCEKIKDISIPDGVVQIGQMAFSGCKSLEKVNIPDNVTVIDEMTFLHCEKLSEVVLPQDLAEIRFSAFGFCHALEKIEIPKNVRVLGNWAFQGSGLKSVAVPHGITSLDDVFSGCENLIEVNIPDSVTKMAAGSFAGCTALEKVTIPDSVTEIGKNSFTNCKKVTISYKGETYNYNTLDKLYYAINGSSTGAPSNKAKMTINDVIYLVKRGGTPDWSDFESFIGEPVAVTPGYIYEIDEEYSVLVSGDQTKSPDSVSFIHDKGNIEQYYSFGDTQMKKLLERNFGAQFDETAQTTAVSNSLPETTATSTTQVSPVATQTLHIPQTMTKISNYMYSKDEDITAVVIPDNVEEIGEYAFINCPNLEKVTIAEGVRIIGDYAFHGCPKLTEINIPDSVTSIGSNTFTSCPNISVSWNGKAYDAEHIYNLYTDFLEKQQTDFSNQYEIVDGVLTISDGVTKIESHAFENWDNITEVVIPDTVTEIGDYAFADTYIEEITLPAKLEKIGEYAFYMCYRLETLEIPDSVTEIGYGSFSRCGALRNVKLSAELEEISDRAFSECTALKSADIPEGVTKIGQEAFSGCGFADGVEIPSSVEEIGAFAFANCSFMKNIVIPEGVESIGDMAFTENTRLETAELPDSLTYFGYDPFYGCNNITISYKGKNYSYNNRDDVLFQINYGIENSEEFLDAITPDETSAPEPQAPDNFTVSVPVSHALNEGSITTYFGYDEWRGASHSGIDIAWDGCYGSPIYAAADGTVKTIRTEADPTVPYDMGLYVIIDHGNGYETVYAHCSEILVKEGDAVSAGDVIAKIGNTGWSTDAHLHFELRKDGTPVDPMQYIK